MDRIKVVHIVHDFLRGGIESFLYYLVKEQIKNPNLEVSIVCCQDERKIINSRITKLGIKIYFVPFRPFEYNLFKYNKILNIVKSYHIIHYQTFIPGLFYYLMFSKNKKLITVHSAGTVLRPTNLLFKIKQVVFTHFLNVGVDLIAYNSHFTRKYWEHKKVKSNIGNVLYNGVYFNTKSSDFSIYSEYPELKNKFVIGTSSRLIPWKRVDLLIHLFSSIIKFLPENVVLLIVGDGSEYDNLNKLVELLGIQKFVKFIGYKSNIVDYQSIMDLVVFPSVEEPFGLVAIECFSLGKPVFVMYDGGGLVEIVSGFSKNFVGNSLDDLGIKILNHIKNNKFDKYESKKYANGFSTTISSKNYFKLYSDLLIS